MIDTLRRAEALLKQADSEQAHRTERLDLAELQELGGLLTRLAGTVGKFAARAADDTGALDMREFLHDDQDATPEERVKAATRALADFTNAMNAVIGSGAVYHETMDHLRVTGGRPVPLHTEPGGIRRLNNSEGRTND